MNNTNIDKDDELLEVSWSGKKLLLKRTKLDEWYHSISFEDRVQFFKDHPHLQQPIAVHKFADISRDEVPNADDFALVHWSGDKLLMIPKTELEIWYNEGYEDHVDWVKKHPDSVLEAK